MVDELFAKLRITSTYCGLDDWFICKFCNGTLSTACQLPESEMDGRITAVGRIPIISFWVIQPIYILSHPY